MLRRPPMTSDECRHRAQEALTLAAQTQDDWERELFQRIATQWVVLAVHKEGKEENRTPDASPTRTMLQLDKTRQGLGRIKRVGEGPILTTGTGVTNIDHCWGVPISNIASGGAQNEYVQ